MDGARVQVHRSGDDVVRTGFSRTRILLGDLKSKFL